MNIIRKTLKSGNYRTKTEQENEQALSLAVKGLINIAIGGIGKTNMDNTSLKIIPVITCSGTPKLREMMSEIIQGHGAKRLDTPLNSQKEARLIDAKRVDSHQESTCAKIVC